jgi:hypothetical protein
MDRFRRFGGAQRGAAGVEAMKTGRGAVVGVGALTRDGLSPTTTVGGRP